MNKKPRHVAIIGAGITGLAAAFHLRQEIEKNQLPLELTLLESKPCLGGKIKTFKHQGFLIEAGPDSFHIKGQSLLDLIQAVGLGDELVHSEPGPAYIFTKRALHPIPEGMIMGVPTKFMSFFKSGLFSLPGKLRVALEILGKNEIATEDESVDSFFRRRFGNELVDRLIEPLFSGIYAESTKQLSAHATMPNMIALLKQHPSLVLGMRKTRTLARHKNSVSLGSKNSGPFISLGQGLQSLVDSIDKSLPESCVLRDTTVKHIQNKNGWYRLILNKNKSLDVDAVILTTPAEIAANLLDLPDSFEILNKNPPASVANVVLAFKEDAIKIHNPGTGFVVSEDSDCSITACTWSHLKWPHTTPQNHALLKCYVGKPNNAAIVNAGDDFIVQTVLSDLKHAMTIQGAPEFHVVTRWHNAMPRYSIGHLSHIARLHKDIAMNFPGVAIAGASYGGVGLSDCAQQGKSAADTALAHLFGKK